LLGVLLLVGAGLSAAGAFSYTSLRTFLLDRVDSTLAADHQGAERNPQGGGPGGGNGTFDVYVQRRSSTGQVTYDSGVPHFPGTTAPSPPQLPATIAVPAQAQRGGPDRVRYFTVSAQAGDGRYRVRASIDPGSEDMLIIATSLSGVDGTLHRLLVIEVLVTLGALAAIVLLGLWIVRLGLRPLDEIVRTADGIAAGDLSRRVERAETRTEVGRLGLALNTMLDRIEESDQRLRRFVADASHELRTPLAAVRGYAALFGRGAAARPDDLERLIVGIGTASERMSALVEDLLLLARLDEHRALESNPVRLEDLAAEAVEMARAVDPSHPIELTAEPLVILGDETRLRQVLDNLLGNTRSHTPPGTAVRVDVRRDAGDALVEVADDGPGMAPEDASRVFERFYRADSSRVRDSGGAGLGLSIVSAVIDAHGGSVSVESEPGRGTTFRVRLPLAPSELLAGSHAVLRTGAESSSTNERGAPGAADKETKT
jgi:two-component system, OmpR family, sensor kinase